jgi:hypothetical protein
LSLCRSILSVFCCQKVSNFILQQIDCQVDRMKNSVNLDNNIPNLATSDSSKVHALRSDLNNDTKKTSCTVYRESISYSRNKLFYYSHEFDRQFVFSLWDMESHFFRMMALDFSSSFTLDSSFWTYDCKHILSLESSSLIFSFNLSSS